MRILISGSTGLVGSALVSALRSDGHTAVRLIRPESRGAGDRARHAADRDLTWSPEKAALDPGADGADAVVHLAGASIADGRWTAARKKVLRDSRVTATRYLIDALGQLPQPPRVVIAASAIGFYGNRGDEELSESSAPGADFLAQVCRDWEAESMGATEFGARVALLRFGVILAKNGGALPKMALPFRLGAGGRTGSGKQWLSWIALEDVIGIIRYALTESSLTGPVNVVAPQPVRNAEFSAALGRVLHRPALLPAPGFALRLALGEMAEALLLASQRVLPKRLEQGGYRFAQPQMEPALASILG